MKLNFMFKGEIHGKGGALCLFPTKYVVGEEHHISLSGYSCVLLVDNCAQSHTVLD